MQTAIIIIIYTVVNLTIIYNGGNNFAMGWLMAFSVDLVIKITKLYSQRKAKHDKYKEWADKLNRGK